MSMNRLVTLLVLCFLTICLTLKAGPKHVHDYIFVVLGVVTGEDGKAVPGAEITLEVADPVFYGAKLIKTAKRVTDDKGGFVFTYISHKEGVKYSLTVCNEGFESQTVSGASPPTSHHAIRLKTPGGIDPSSQHE